MLLDVLTTKDMKLLYLDKCLMVSLARGQTLKLA